MPDDNRRKVSFTPRYSIFTPKKNISFKMLENFDFSSIKNIITLKFIPHLISATTYIFAKSKDNKLKLKNSKPNINITVEAKIKVNKIKFINVAKAKLLFFFSSKIIMLKLKSLGNSILKLFTKGHETIKFNLKSNEHLVLYSIGQTKLKFTNIVNAVLKIFLKGGNNSIVFKNNRPKVLETIYAKSNEDNTLILQNTAKSDLVMLASSFENKVAFKNMASAVVYRPNTIGYFYNFTLEEMYDKTLDELYGVELL